MTISRIICRSIVNNKTSHFNIIIKDHLSKKFDYFLVPRLNYSTVIGSNKNILEKYGSYSNYLIQQEIEKRESKLKKETVNKYVRKLKMRETNILKAPMLYEGPVYINYWMRKRRSGTRK